MEVDPQKLREARRRRGLTQELLAARSGVARGTIQRIESRSKSSLRPQTLLVIAKTLGVDPKSLVRTPPAPSRDTAPSDLALHSGLPPLPRSLVGRERDLAAMREALAPGHRESQRVLVVDGWPGVGKTTLASSLARDPELLSSLTAGVLWASLGQSANLRSILVDWGRSVGFRDVELTEMPNAELSARLTHVLREEPVLIVIDDAWSTSAINLLRVGGERSSLLVTTRITALADELASPAQRYRLGVLDRDSAVALLRSFVPDAVDQHQGLCSDLVEQLERLPLAIHVAGALLRAEMRHGFTVVDLLADLASDARPIYESKLPSDLASDTAPTVAALLARSTAVLDTSTRWCFAALGAFLPKPVVFDEAAVRAVWDRAEVRPILGELIDRGLVETAAPGRYQMHAIVKMHAEAILRSMP